MAGRKAQANALFRKNWSYQRASVCSTCLIICAPIFFCLLLAALQAAVNSALDTRDNKCGCRCLECCDTENDPSTCHPATEDRPCPVSLYSGDDALGTCEKYDDDDCSLQWSDAEQAGFCSVPNPSIWPALQQVPPLSRRAQPYAPDITMMWTAQNRTALTPLVDRLFALQGNLSTAAVTAQLQNLAAFNLISGFSSVQMAQGGLTLGTSSEAEFNLYIEPALEEILDVMSRTNCSGIPGLEDGEEVDMDGLRLRCGNVIAEYQENTAAINNELFCGFEEAFCGGVSTVQAYTDALDLKDTTPGKLATTIIFNDTTITSDDDGNTGPTAYQRVNQILNQVAQSFTSWMLDRDLPVQLVGVSDMPKPSTKLRLDFSSLLGPLFYLWVIQLCMPVQLTQLVYEKERRLRMMMKMHGLGDSMYWVITYLFYLAVFLVFMIVFMVFGAIIRLNFFRLNNVGVQLIFYFMFGNVQIAQTFLFSALFKNTRTAVVVAFLWVFGSGLIAWLLIEPFIERERWYVILLELVPAFGAYRGLYEFGQYAFRAAYQDSDGLTFSGLNDDNNHMVLVWIIWLIEWPLFILLAWYLEQVTDSGTGIRRPPLFFLDGCRGKKKKVRGSDAGAQAVVSIDGSEAEDVAAERRRVHQMAESGQDQQTAILCNGLRKVYPPQDGNPQKIAVRDLTLGVERGECFGLLGPNGAGKSTSINMLVGLLEPTAGSALIEGMDIRQDMLSIYSIMGVCPQHDLLWDILTGAQHLLFYGRLKGLLNEELKSAVKRALENVNLYHVADKPVGKYSGGMKRRLSVAISLIGNPRVVYMDEPSTGLDPASRRNLWDVVKAAKRNTSLILTTHSMEEAEVLCDRLGIFVDGQLVCLGNPKELSVRHGGYLVFTITVPTDQQERAHNMLVKVFPSAKRTYALAGTIKYELPSSDIRLQDVFSSMEKIKNDIVVLDWGIANATLEEVFIKFARRIGAVSNDK